MHQRLFSFVKAMRIGLCFLFVATTWLEGASAFVRHNNPGASSFETEANGNRNIQAGWVPPPRTARLSLEATKTTLPTLTEETAWKMRFLLQGLPTEKGKKVNEIFVIDAYFIEETGYEPPQGSIQQLSLALEKGTETAGEDETSTPRFKVLSSRWQLSEDPNDRKDGLWVWGLFKEPLYPFMLLQIETDRIPLPGTDEDAIKPLKLYAQFRHKREKDAGVVLEGGDLKVRVIETVKADPLGAATVDIYEEFSIGKLNIQAVL